MILLWNSIYSFRRCDMGLFGLGKSIREEKKWIQLSKEMDVLITIHDPLIIKKLEMIDLTVEDLKLIKALQPLIEEQIETYV